jgi:acyl-coenzyme A thioesterase PaaI-like protein
MGSFNPLSPPVIVKIEDGVVQGTATFGYPYEGPPTCVHGGVLALAFDELLGAANFLSGSPGMTGTLTVKYRRPTPLMRPLRLEAKVVSKEGRKITTWGGVYDGDELTAEAEGIFIEVFAEKFIAMVSSRDDGGASLRQLKADAEETGNASRFRSAAVSNKPPVEDSP